MSDRTDSCCGGDDCGEPTRRSFLQQTAVLGAGFLGPIALPRIRRSDAVVRQGDHFVPDDKKLTAQWLAALLQQGAPAAWTGAQLRTVAMPCGGIAAGQLYVTGDGRLSRWWIANDACHTSYGGDTRVSTPGGEIGVGYGTNAPEREVLEGVVVLVRGSDGAFAEASLQTTSFLGEYPVATIDARTAAGQPPLSLRAEVFSPFVPLSAKDSALPATVLRYRLQNDGPSPITAVLARYGENPVLRSQRGVLRAQLRNVVVRQDRFVAVVMDAVEGPPRATAGNADSIVFADFERGYGEWRSGAGDTAFGPEPATGTLDRQQPVTGFHGQRLVNTFLGGDDSTGMLVSPEFTIEKRCIAFRIGGGQDVDELALQLQVFEQAPDSAGGGSKQAWVRRRTATGLRKEQLREAYWEVSELVGTRARLCIRDQRKGPWGHVNVDYIRFCDAPPEVEPVLQTHPQAGQVALCALDDGAAAFCGDHRDQLDAWLRGGAPPTAPTAARSQVDRPPLAAVANTVTLQPGEARTVTFAITWHFANRLQRDDEGLDPGQQCGTDGPRVGNRYAAWFGSALAVAQHLHEHGERLLRDTFLFRDSLYRDTTLPGWFVQRVGMPLSTLATGVLQWWQDGRVWAWEGVGCCAGTCGHVWNYAQGMARLFPELERSVREQQDFAAGHGMKPDGAIGFRGTGRSIWAGDAQGGYVLKALREHLCSRDDSFLQRNWPAIKRALEFLIERDGDGNTPADGVLEGKQHNTYDIDFYGANTMVGSLYLAALAAGARMATHMGDAAFAAHCEQLRQRGSEQTMQRLWNGRYFVQQVDLQAHPKWQYGDGCLSDQLLGQWFADQLDLGHLYPRDTVRTALQSIYRYNWAPDCGPQMRAHPPERHFASDGEAGLFTCTWPDSAHMGRESVRYRDEVWSGIEYQVAAHLLREGFVTEGLAIVRGIHERYCGSKHNPYNEVECGDHYARALASWSCLLAISGFQFDGPAGVLGFAPRLLADDFRCFFSGCDGWGTLGQTRAAGVQVATIELRWGALRLSELRLAVAEGHRVRHVTAAVGDAPVAVHAPDQHGLALTIRLVEPADLLSGQTLALRLQ